MMTPASRSGGVLASAPLRSANRVVPAAFSPVGRDEVTQRTCRLGMPPRLRLQLALDGGGLLGPAGDRLAEALVDDDDGDVGEAFALLLAQRRVGEREQQGGQRQGPEQRAARAPHEQRRAPAARPAQRPPRTGPAAPSARSQATSCSCKHGSYGIPLPLAGRGWGGGTHVASHPARGRGRCGRDVVPACTAHRHCPSRSRGAGTCTRSAL